MRKLPPLNSLKAFEATAQHLSISKAASSLGVTQGAVSKQIKLLEEFLGFALFERLHQSLELTKEGKKYLSYIAKALDIIESGTNIAKEKYSNHEELRVNILPSLSSRWLVPLLDDFHNRYPWIQIHMDIGDGEVNLTRQKTDIAIRSGKAPAWPKYHSEKFMGEVLLPIYSAELKEIKPVHKPADLRHHKLLKHTTRPHMWEEYLAANKASDIPVKYGTGFEHFFMLIEAVKDGMGIALLPEFLIKKELAQKKLHVALKSNFKSPYGYYFICSKAAIKERKIMAFTSWLNLQAKNLV